MVYASRFYEVNHNKVNITEDENSVLVIVNVFYSVSFWKQLYYIKEVATCISKATNPS